MLLVSRAEVMINRNSWGHSYLTVRSGIKVTWKTATTSEEGSRRAHTYTHGRMHARMCVQTRMHTPPCTHVIYVYMHACTHGRMHARMHVYAYTHARADACIYVHVYARTHARKYVLCICVRVNVDVCVRVCACRHLDVVFEARSGRTISATAP